METIFKEIKENMRMMSHQIENISKETEIIFFEIIILKNRNQIEITQLKIK